jgi:hypothetical protein
LNASTCVSSADSCASGKRAIVFMFRSIWKYRILVKRLLRRRVGILPFFCGECSVRERQPIRLSAAVNRVPRLHLLRERHHIVAPRATDPVGEEAVGRKKLFRRVTRLSGRGPVNRHLALAHASSPASRPPKTFRPTSKASASAMPAPCSCWLLSHHARRCSSDRKKFSFVQRTAHARPSSGLNRVTHTMTS